MKQKTIYITRPLVLATLLALCIGLLSLISVFAGIDIASSETISIKSQNVTMILFSVWTTLAIGVIASLRSYFLVHTGKKHFKGAL
jgi:hypothetical protein